ncbi:integrase arm-type DNA-binding domain-containing protein [Asticcacaulis sp. EMRT-3]|uniref:tyrosine-type recombinase/integrase n=1 Tax=Asticcacaulis sp. EMRT-3 TaxID=3040349 RepID=UPI0024AF22FA|nr:integrase arm-type DNA-binding domain-containing protein [Asticcacaulis sp. EMRT-3]MDI7775592.1 tyrosine-type recombinase/integrase [Asticcacaulis sp. EMRT-3]
MPLSDTAIRSAKPGAKPYKLSDGNSLYLLVMKNGSRLWQVRYRFDSKENVLSLGQYPHVTLKTARQKRDEAKELLARGIDPNADKKRKVVEAAVAAGNTFDTVAQEFIDLKVRDGLSDATTIKLKWFRSQLEKDIGGRPIAEIEPLEILAALRKIEKKGNYETSKRTRAFADRVFRYAIITGRAKTNPANGLGDALISGKVRHHAALIAPKAVGDLLRAIEAYDGSILTKLALNMLAHVFVRPGELRHAEWAEFDLKRKVWLIPAAKMKMRADHAVPLSTQVLALLEPCAKFKTASKYLFPSFMSGLKPMSENTLNTALRRMGYTNDEMTSHGFRSTASTLLNESGKWSPDAIERALAHKDSNTIRGIYHRGAHWDERVQMMQWWSDYLEQLQTGGEVIALRRDG